MGLCFTLAAEGSTEASSIEGMSGSLGNGVKIQIVPGEGYLHDFPVLLGIHRKNPPQMALWIESESGEFLQTLMVTDRVGSQSWLAAPKDPERARDIRRPEALPVWSHRQGYVAPDGIPMPTRDEPAADAVSVATPKEGYALSDWYSPEMGAVRVFLEVNHSTDFSDTYAADLEPDDPHYGGGQFGSGQPSLIYSCVIEPEDIGARIPLEMALMGHGSPSGANGDISSDMVGITSALNIIASAAVVFD